MGGINAISKIPEGVYFDSVDGVPGTSWPTGTPEQPVNNETDLRTILTARALSKVVMRNVGTTLKFTSPLSGITFIAEGEPSLCPTVDFNGQIIECTFINLKITDTFTVSGVNSNNDPVVMIDAGAAFVPGSLIGEVIKNTTDHSAGVITDNTGTSITVAALTDGTANAWAAGDGYTVAGNTRSPSEFWNCDIVTVIATANWPQFAIYHNCYSDVWSTFLNPPFGRVQSYNCTWENGLGNTSGSIFSHGGSILYIVNGSGSISADANGNSRIDSITNGSGAISIYGDFAIPAVINGSGVIDIWGNPTIGAVTNASGGIINLHGATRILGLITNAGTLNYQGVYPEVPVSLITARLTGAIVGVFHPGDTVSGDTSFATGIVYTVGGGFIDVKGIVGVFLPGDTVSNVAGATIGPPIAITAGIVADVFHLAKIDGFHYTVDKLIIKSDLLVLADLITVKLKSLVNGALLEVSSFDISLAGTNPWTGYYNLNTMFGVDHLSGDELEVTVEQVGINGGPYTITGSYCYRSS